MDFDVQWHDNSGKLNFDEKDLKMSFKTSTQKSKRKPKFIFNKIDQGLQYLKQWKDICKYTRRSK